LASHTFKQFKQDNGSGKGQGQEKSGEQGHTDKIFFSASAIRALTDIWLDFKRDDGYIIKGLQLEAGKKFEKFFIDPIHHVSEVYNRKDMISKLTDEHNMEKHVAEEIVDQLIKGEKITVPDGSLGIMKCSASDRDSNPLYRLVNYPS